MTLLDSDTSDLLRGFRADEGILDDTTRRRMWARITDDVSDAASAFDDLGTVEATIRPLPPSRRPTATRIVAIAATVLVLGAVAGIAIRSGRDGDTPVTAGSSTTPTTISAIPTLDDLADAAAARPEIVLGSSPAARYSHWIETDTVRDGSGDPTTERSEIWMDREGFGRIIEGDRDETVEAGSGRSVYGGLSVAAAEELPDDADDALATYGGLVGVTEPSDLSRGVVSTLAIAGLPGRTRALFIRMLDRIGFVVVPGDDTTRTLLRVEGPGAGERVQADIDIQAGRVVAWSTTGGSADQSVTYTVVALRADAAGS